MTYTDPIVGAVGSYQITKNGEAWSKACFESFERNKRPSESVEAVTKNMIRGLAHQGFTHNQIASQVGVELVDVRITLGVYGASA